MAAALASPTVMVDVPVEKMYEVPASAVLQQDNEQQQQQQRSALVSPSVAGAEGESKKAEEFRSVRELGHTRVQHASQSIE